MTIRQDFGRLYRTLFKASRRLGLRHLPVCRNGTWTSVPIEMWDGFRLVYEPYLEQALRRLLKPGDVFVDVGAHFGIWSAVASRLVGPTGVVLACEPSPAFRVLQNHIEHRANVRLRNVAIGAAAGSAAFHAQGVSSSGSMRAEVTDINRLYSPEVPVTEIRVRMTTMNLLASEERIRPTVVKIDVEGYELEVLRGARQVLADGAACIIEIHPPQLRMCGACEEAVFDLLNQSAYAIEVIDRNSKSLYTIVATKQR